jgi:hypothetical protein
LSRCNADVLEVLIGKMGKDGDVDAVLRKCASVLGQTEPSKPIGYFLHRRPRRAEFGPVDPLDGRFYPIDRAARNRPERSAAGVTGGQPEEPQTEAGPSTPRPAAENQPMPIYPGARHSGCSGLTNRFRAPCSPRRETTMPRRVVGLRKVAATRGVSASHETIRNCLRSHPGPARFSFTPRDCHRTSLAMRHRRIDG